MPKLKKTEDCYRLHEHTMRSRRGDIKKTVCAVLNGSLTRNDAAKNLRVTLRTVHNYVKKYLDHGPEGLRDHRKGHFRKLEPEHEMRIVACKLDSPRRSARWIRDRLRLPVTPEAIRQVLLKHRLNRVGLRSRDALPENFDRWNPF